MIKCCCCRRYCCSYNEEKKLSTMKKKSIFFCFPFLILLDSSLVSWFWFWSEEKTRILSSPLSWSMRMNIKWLKFLVLVSVSVSVSFPVVSLIFIDYYLIENNKSIMTKKTIVLRINELIESKYNRNIVWYCYLISFDLKTGWPEWRMSIDWIKYISTTYIIVNVCCPITV